MSKGRSNSPQHPPLARLAPSPPSRQPAPHVQAALASSAQAKQASSAATNRAPAPHVQAALQATRPDRASAAVLRSVPGGPPRPLAPHVQAAIAAVQPKAAPPRLNTPQRQPPACPPPAPCRGGTVQRASQQTYTALYDLDQSEHPALRFHKNKDWREALKENGEFRGDAYTLRDPDYNPLLKSFLGRTILDNRMTQEPDLPEDYGTHEGYKAGLAATVERAIHRSIMEHTELVHLQRGTVADLVKRLQEAGPLLVVNVRGPAGYERYYSPTMEHWSFGKVGKRIFTAEDVLQEIPMITPTVLNDMNEIMGEALNNNTLPRVREILIGRALESVRTFLDTRYGGGPFPHIPIHVPTQQTQSNVNRTIVNAPRIYNVPLDFDVNSQAILDALADLSDSDDDLSY